MKDNSIEKFEVRFYPKGQAIPLSQTSMMFTSVSCRGS